MIHPVRSSLMVVDCFSLAEAVEGWIFAGCDRYTLLGNSSLFAGSDGERVPPY